jgi:1,4-dihydroxy-2-naphthoate octaprenyltransferase
MKIKIQEKFNLLVPITRVEFIPANSASVLIGFAWAISEGYVLGFKTIGIFVSLFLVLSAVGTLGAHWNSYSDYEMDAEDATKKDLHKSLSDLGKNGLKVIIRVEMVLAAIIFILFLINSFDWKLIGLWIISVFFAFSYSMPPARFKGRGPLAFISLCLVLSVLPILFVYLSINQSLSAEFMCFLVGHTMVVYSLIIPTEIRDYAVDKRFQVCTMTVWLGLKKVVIFSEILIVLGSGLIISSYIKTEYFLNNPIAIISLLGLVVCNGFVFSKFNQLRKLINSISRSDGQNKKASALAKNNPKWITISSIGSMAAALATAIVKIFP